MFETRATTLPGFLASTQHAQRWAGEHYGTDGCLDANDTLSLIATDAERILRAALDGRAGLRPDLSRVPAAELAALPFEPVDHAATPCPVPSRDAWIGEADLMLPWMRMGWLYMSLDRGELADAMLAEDAGHAEGFNESLLVTARNFDQLARFARTVLDRRMIGTAALAVREGVEG